MRQLSLEPARRAKGAVRLPGSKSISNRVLLLAALAQGETVMRNLLDADDTRVMMDALRKLGVACDREKVHGAGGAFPVRSAELFLGNAGTAFRPLTAVLAFCNGEYRLSGVPRMHERPIGDLVDALRNAGARIDYLGAEGFPPLAIHPARIEIQRPLPIRGETSSQFVSALLMALPLAGGGTVVIEGSLISRPYVDITVKLMARFGIDVRTTEEGDYRVPAGPYRSPGTIDVEGDASSASYFLAAGAIAGGPVRVQGLGGDSIQGDVRFVEVLQAMGANITLGDSWIEASSGGKRLTAFDLDLNHIPDAAMTAAVLALFADGPCRIRNVGSWRVKETDRIAAMATELRKLGARVEEGVDSLRIVPPPEPKAGMAIDTYDDHRMAMCFSLVALAGVSVTINDPDCVAKTFPDYFKAFRSLFG
ncbi:MAG TPA: 3-phosphoshikimate 1-carboxyvinyltransferase [Burkholderiales bacterium]|nr:3-phosphoshikimate 1-carboxyvinyltransferase [Burkholderiales bacterium]